MTEATFERKTFFGGLLTVSDGESLITVVERMAAVRHGFGGSR